MKGGLGREFPHILAAPSSALSTAAELPTKGASVVKSQRAKPEESSFDDNFTMPEGTGGKLVKSVHISLGELVRRLHTDGGFTIHLPTGTVPTVGYAVSLASCEACWDLATFSIADLRGYILAHLDILQDAYLGAWVYNGNVYLDVSVILPDLSEALTFGRDQHQLAVFDLTATEEIAL
jgi:hypothetical protein